MLEEKLSMLSRGRKTEKGAWIQHLNMSRCLNYMFKMKNPRCD